MQKRKSLFFLALLVVMFIPRVQAQKITLADVVSKGTFRPKTVEGLRSMNDGLHYTTLEKDGTEIVKYSYKTGEKVATVLSVADLKIDSLKNITDYEFSSDESRVMLMMDKHKIYRRSFTAQYYVYNFTTKEVTPLSTKGRQQLATFSPNGERVAFVRDNNLFVKSLRFGTERQITFDGKRNHIINGAPDWVYEEEFEFNKAFAWSPDSKKLAFMKFNEEAVPTYSFPMYKGEEPAHMKNRLYPHNYAYKYPKAGEPNSTVEVYVYDIKSRTSIDVDLGTETDQYIPRIRWIPNASELAVLRENRLQNKLDVLFANPFSGDTRLVYTEKNDRYIETDFLDNLKFLSDNKHFVITSEQDGYNHLYLYDFSGIKVKRLTDGDYDVTKFYGYDPDRELFYYQAAAESPLRREVYAVSLDKKKKYKLSEQEGTNDAVFSSGFKYYINYFTNVKTPMYVTLHDYRGKLIRVLEDNAALKQKMADYQIPQKEFFTFKNSEGVELNGWMIKPLNFNPNQKYPVVMTQYSGPNSQEVLDKFSVDWYSYLAQDGYVVACVDPRGTGARGENFRKCTYMQLGKLESDDQVDAAKYLGSLPFTDKNNIAIWGWSYGGFMSALSLEKGAGIFEAAIAVAPVTNWRYYDTIYTERYMRTPEQNPDGYDDNSPLNHAAEIKGKLLLVHGSADDNVHLQNSMEFAEEMVQAGVQFQMMIYNNRNHSIYGGNTRMHLYTMFTDFLNNNLKK